MVVVSVIDLDCRAFFYYDISSINDLATIDKVSFYAYVYKLGSAGHRADFHALDNASSQTIQSLFFDTSNGNLYIDDDQGLRNNGDQYKTWDLGPNAKLDLQANLIQDWFGIGIEEEGDNDQWGDLGTFEDSNPP